MKLNKWGGMGVLLSALLLTATACTAAATTPHVHQRLGGNYYSSSQLERKYTKADYELLSSLHAAGYEKLTIAEFNAKAFDWRDEDAYHKTEEALFRLLRTLPDTDPLSPLPAHHPFPHLG